jgi:anaerobic magnesium-protoporphyrin IX monomethyl ester cyclase
LLLLRSCPFFKYLVRERSTNSIIEELFDIKSKYPETNSIRILDDLFLKNNKSLIKAINIYSKFDFQWRSMAHIKTFNNTSQVILAKLKESGCNELFIGIESGSPRILKSINKTHDLNLIINNFKKIFQAKINVKAYFIYGFPDEKLNDMQMTYNLVCKLKEMSIEYGSHFRPSIFQFRPYHGTIIYNKLKRKYPKMDIGKISHNNNLTTLIGRRQINFRGNNYSKVSLKIIDDYICKTNKVGNDNEFRKP